MYWQFIGFGLTVGWMWMFFLGGPVFAALLKPWQGTGDVFFQFFLLLTAISNITIKKWGGSESLSSNKRYLIAGALCMTVSPGLIFLLSQSAMTHPLVSLFFFILDAVGAWGCVVMMLAWQESFTAISFRKTCLVYAGGIGIASLSLFLGALFHVQLGILLTILHPIASMLLLFKYQKSTPLPPYQTTISGSSSTDTLRRIYPVKLIILIILFYAAGGLMYKLASLKYTFADLFWASNISYMIVVALAGTLFFFLPNLDLRLLYRPVLPLLAMGFILFPFLTGIWVILSFLMLQAGFALFDMYTYLLIVYIARNHPRPTPILGLGMFWISFSIFTGNLAFSSIASFIPIHSQLNSLVIIAGLITLLTALVFQDNRETFVGWETRETAATLIQQNNETDPPRFSEDEPYFQPYHLTAREMEILNIIRKGRNNPYICEKLNISPNTLKFHLRNIYQKFSVNNRQELLSLFEDESNKII